MRHVILGTFFLVWYSGVSLTPGIAKEATFADDFQTAQTDQWQRAKDSAGWNVERGVLNRTGSGDSLYRAAIEPHTDLEVESRLRVLDGGRENFGVALRVAGQTYLLVRYYDQAKALELLSYRDGEMSQLGDRSAKFSVHRGEWYRLKVVALGDRVLAKMWEEDSGEPDWQLDVTVSNLQPGGFAIVAQDDTRVEFDSVKATDESSAMIQLQADLQQREQLRLAEIWKDLKLAVTSTTIPASESDLAAQRLHIVPYALNDRAPVAGDLTVSWGEHRITRTVTLADYDQEALSVDLLSPTGPTAVHIELIAGPDKMLESTYTATPTEQLPWRDYVGHCLDSLIAHGRDEYGKKHTPLFMAVLDADILRSPSKPMLLDALVRLEGRLHRRGERGANPWYDQSLFRSLYRMSDLTGDSQYSLAADQCISYFFDHCYKEIDPANAYLNGMPAWGTHVYWDCYRERPGGDGDGNGPHELLVYRADWESMLRLRPHAVRLTADGIWRYHVVDKTSGLFNRHDDGNQGCDFAFAGGSFACAMASMYHSTGQQKYLEWAKTIVNWHWNNRNRETNLTADTPGLTRRYDGNHCFTTVAGPHCLSLLECYRLTGDAHFRDVAISYIKAFDRYGWDEKQQTYWAMLQLDGTPVPDRAKGSGYDAFAPFGHVDVWRSTIYSYEFTLAAAQAAISAYETTSQDGSPDAELLKIAQRWGGVVERALPPKSSHRWKAELEQAMPKAAETGGSYAEDYGRAISLFVHLYRATDDQHQLELAESLATEAVAKLYRNGLFVGHPAKPYYENTDGVGLLLLALLELDSPEGFQPGAW